jgi:hypothetical protein
VFGIVAVWERSGVGNGGLGGRGGAVKGGCVDCRREGGWVGGDGPDACVVVRGTGCQVADVRGEENTGDVCCVCLERGYGDEGCDVAVLDHAPDVDVAGVVAGAEESAVGGDGDGRYGYVFFGDELVRALVLAEIPDAYVAGAVARDEFALVGVDDDVVDGAAMGVVALDASGAGIPDLNGAVFGGSHHPFAFAVEGYAGDVPAMTNEGEEGGGVGGADVVELDVTIACCGKEALVWRDA